MLRIAKMRFQGVGGESVHIFSNVSVTNKILSRPLQGDGVQNAVVCTDGVYPKKLELRSRVQVPSGLLINPPLLWWIFLFILK